MRIWQDFVVFVLQFILPIAQIPLFIYTAISVCVQKIMFKLSLAIRVISLSEMSSAMAFIFGIHM